MILILLTFLATTSLYAALLVFGCRRVVRHLQGHPEAMRAVTEHVVVPLFGKKPSDAETGVTDGPRTIA